MLYDIHLLINDPDRRIHEPIGRAAGLTDSHIAAISDKSNIMEASKKDDLPPVLAAAMDFCDASTIHVKVPQEAFDRLKAFLDAQEIVEVAAIIGAFNMISRFCVSLDVAEVGSFDVPSTGSDRS